MKRPSFQFYPGDWQANSNLRRCTHAEKGVWLDVLCLMHDQPEYGVLRWPLKEIAQAVGAKLSDLKGLCTKQVLKGSDAGLAEAYIYTPRSGRKDGEPVTLLPIQDGPIWYSSRMVKDEYVRTIRGESSRFGEGNDEAPKHSPKPPFGDGSSSSSSSSIKTYTAAVASEKYSMLDDLVSRGVSEQIASDWLKCRKAKKLANTMTAMEGVANEAEKAGLSLHDALTISCKQGWGGFKAAWLQNDSGLASNGKPWEEA